MEMSKKMRSSNLELLRILCILAIISDHFTGQSGMAGGVWPLFTCAMTSLSRVACSVFVIISAWFLVDKPFQFKKIAHTWLTVIMYTVPITLYCMHIGIASKLDLFRAFLPIEGSPLWFAGYYMVLVLLSPALNLLMKEENRRIHEWIIFVLFCLSVLYTTVTAEFSFLSDDIWILIFLYLVTGYIKKYKRVPEYKSCLLVFGCVWLLLTGLRAYIAGHSSSNLYIFTLLGNYCETYRARLQTLPNLILAYSAFFGFYGLQIKPLKFINTIASATLGVYCFHQVPTWFNYLWTDLFKSTMHAEMLVGYQRALYIILSIILVWIIGTVLELLRKKVSGFLIEGRKCFHSFCGHIDNMVYSTGNNEKRGMQKRQYIVIVFIVIYFAAVKFISVEHYWYIPLNTEQSLIGENLQLDISGDLIYKDGDINGTITITNHGAAIQNLSSGTYPVKLGVSIVDWEGMLIDLDFLHQDILTTGVLKKNASVDVAISLPNMSGYIDNGYGIRLEIVQEFVSWIDETAQYYWFE